MKDIATFFEEKDKESILGKSAISNNISDLE